MASSWVYCKPEHLESEELWLERFVRTWEASVEQSAWLYGH